MKVYGKKGKNFILEVTPFEMEKITTALIEWQCIEDDAITSDKSFRLVLKRINKEINTFNSLPLIKQNKKLELKMNQEEIEAMRAHLKSGGTKIITSPMLYPTPPEIAKYMAQELNLRPEYKVLEPSAGSGNLVRAIAMEGVKLENITAIEIDNNLSYTLSNQYPEIYVIHGDFLNLKGIHPEYYDRIIMNPPFEKQADIDHVLHALKSLKKDGGLITVMSEGTFFKRNKKTNEFWDIVKSMRFYSDEKLPDGAFKNSGTMVKTRLLKIIK